MRRFRAPRNQQSEPSYAKPQTSKSACRYRQSLPKHAHATVSRPFRVKVRILPCKTAEVQKRAPLPPESPLEYVSEYAPMLLGCWLVRIACCWLVGVGWVAAAPRMRVPFGARWRWVGVGWRELVAAVWWALGARRRRDGRRRRAGGGGTVDVQPKMKNPAQYKIRCNIFKFFSKNLYIYIFLFLCFSQ